MLIDKACLDRLIEGVAWIILPVTITPILDACWSRLERVHLPVTGFL
jgi:hypothetical protein